MLKGIPVCFTARGRSHIIWKAVRIGRGHAGWGILPLSAMLLLAIMLQPRTAGHAAPLPSSGDPLYDRLAQLIDSDLHRAGYDLVVPDDYIIGSGVQLPHGIGRISSGAVVSWEEDFGDRPEYWQLCWLLRSHGTAEDYLRQELYHSSELLAAWESGIRDEAGCYLLFLQADEKDRARFIRAGLGMWPDNSFWHYKSAEARLAAGDWRGFLLGMQAGNAATRNELPRPWPLDLLRDGADLPRDEDSLAVQGVLVQLARSQREKALASPLLPVDVRDAGTLDPQFVEEFLLMQVRIARMDGNGLEQLWRPAVAINGLLLAPGLGENWEEGQLSMLREKRGIASELALADAPALFGARLEEQPWIGEDSGQPLYERDRGSWINTLQSFRMDLRLLASRQAEFFRLLSPGSTGNEAAD